ncbi:MAG TPA: CoB--CoM heterodisulfide reductase iron-sulfur subunit B family protein [Candidatus Sumerlaeota bacterium]|nr:CoB--CoM heterodisulfide reductase iron-sulfur subunit B family protein [Candidatus Sumerlaeota bacterium]HPS01978.1 CoB--CoM heterodisulfide reductase iron-sulfur subunit B family protein [Candidatus Sumerlaeota bacterium]
MMEIGYYPGCALHGSSNDYEKSVQACMGALGARLKELDDWICCGASAAHVINKTLSVALPARNLGLAERDGVSELLAPCPMCSMELIKARRELVDNPGLRQKISEIVEIGLEGKTDVVNLIQVFQKIGIETIRAAVKMPLEGIKAACYYGCLLTRPASVLQFDDCEHPRSMENILEVLGAGSVDWNYKTECCGAGMTMANEPLMLELSNKILANAKAHGANCLVVACPMCHVNLDMKQADVERQYGTNYDLPVYYLSDLVGLALGLSEQALGIDKHFVVKR